MPQTNDNKSLGRVAHDATVRDYFAAGAMNAILPMLSADAGNRQLIQELAELCFKIADAMMEARNAK